MRLEDELSKKVAKFEKRLSETDPVSGTPRYGESMTAKVEAGTCCSTLRRHETKVVAMGYISCSGAIRVFARNFSCDLVGYRGIPLL